MQDDFVPLLPYYAWIWELQCTDAWVSWYDGGAGRLQPVDSEPFVNDIYIHYTILEHSKIETLNKQNRVKVLWIQCPKGPRAILVEVPNG